ncbi:putative quinol monooxygenase [Georgenia sp. SYP-B2076]|uniref:putative quinol monooxygenase n=1 Tax=Georgenia sp. SYP-B2076 TaxID=2495881 RepID=UPI000F8F2BC4|nr:putative quinol monooxygenase [Georgenia sp. SYP-B2076]
MTYGLIGKLTAQAGRREELVDLLLQAAEALTRDPGCLHYVVSTSDEPEAVWVWEVWADKAAHDASLEPADVRALIRAARPLIAGMSDQAGLAVLGGKGLPR